MIGKGTNLWQQCHMCLIMTDYKKVYYHRFINVFMTLCKNSQMITYYQYAIRKPLTNWVGGGRKRRFDLFVLKLNWKHWSTLSFFAKKLAQSVIHEQCLDPLLYWKIRNNRTSYLSCTLIHTLCVKHSNISSACFMYRVL